MRYLILFLVALVNLIFTGAIFPNINIVGIAPDIIVCTMASITILEKKMTGAIIGLICGLVLDLVFSGSIGFYTIPYFVTGMILYFVCTRVTYIDKVLFPFLFAAAANFAKEILFAIMSYMMGISFSFSYMLIRYILPEALFTGVFMYLIHFLLTRIYRSSHMKQTSLKDIRKL